MTSMLFSSFFSFFFLYAVKGSVTRSMYSMEFSKNFALEDNSPDTLSSFHVKRYWVICVLVKWRHDERILFGSVQ